MVHSPRCRRWRGIVSAVLATRFKHIVVSDPNDGYTAQARENLVERSGLPETSFTFLQEPAEESWVEPGTVDLITAAEMIQWTDTDAAVQNFARQLKVGGTVAITSYTRPRIVGNQAAQKAWQDIFTAYSERTQGLGDLYDRAFRTMNTGLQNVALPENQWEDIRRIYINADGDIKSFRIDARLDKGRVGQGEEIVWEEGDQDWADTKGIVWFKSYFATWVPRIPEHEIQGLWDALEHCLQGHDARIQTPIVMIFATKKRQ